MESGIEQYHITDVQQDRSIRVQSKTNEIDESVLCFDSFGMRDILKNPSVVPNILWKSMIMAIKQSSQIRKVSLTFGGVVQS